MSNQQKLYLHIGMPKTGTTSIQQFLSEHKQTLQRDHNIYYPKSPGKVNHLKLAAYASPETTKDVLDGMMSSNWRQSFFKYRFGLELQQAVKKKMQVLVSNEHLWSRISDVSAIEKLLSLFDGLNVRFKVICYLRPQEDYIFSSYSTWIKSGSTQPLVLNKVFKHKKFNYLEKLKLWSEVLSAEDSLIVRPYQPTQWQEMDLLKDFLHSLNINWQETLNTANYKLNTKLSIEHLEKLRLLNLELERGNKQQKEIQKIREHAIEQYESESNNVKDDSRAEIKQEIMDHFKPMNDMIANKYLKGKTKLFN